MSFAKISNIISLSPVLFLRGYFSQFLGMFATKCFCFHKCFYNTANQIKEILHVAVILPQISKATLSEEMPRSSSSLEGLEQQEKFKNKHVSANKGVCTSYLFWFM